MERLIGLLDVKGDGKPSAFQRKDESKFYEWAKNIEEFLTGSEPQLAAMLTWAFETRPGIRQSMIADMFPTEQVDGFAQMVVRLKTVLAQITEGEVAQHCGRNGLEAWRGLHKRFDFIDTW